MINNDNNWDRLIINFDGFKFDGWIIDLGKAHHLLWMPWFDEELLIGHLNKLVLK
jgi:hypothetical protein